MSDPVTSFFESIATIDIPSAYRFLFEPAPYKVLYGGRNAGKDWNTVRVDLILGMMYDPAYTDKEIELIKIELGKALGITNLGLIEQSLRHPHRFMYCREVMESIKRSVYTTIKDQIYDLGLQNKWKIKDASIECVNGSDMIFAGLYRDPHNIKSAEGVTMCRVVEAQNVSEDSWKYLIPTIRKEGAEILVSFNPQYEDDPTYQRWVVNPPKEAVIRKINSTDIEAYLTNSAKLNRKNDYALRRHEYKNIWEGEPLGKGRKIWPFNEGVHVKKFDRVWLKDRAMFFMSCDPAQRHYPACLWFAWFHDDLGSLIKYIYTEYPEFSDFSDYYSQIRKSIVFTGTYSDLSMQFRIHDGHNEYGYEINKRFIDTRYAQGTGAQNFSNSTVGIIGEFAKKENGGIEFECPDIKIIDAQRENIIKDMEFDATQPLTAFNHPHLYVDPGCLNLIQSLKLHREKEDSNAEDQKYKDFSDCFTGGTPIWTLHGWKAIKKIKIGDTVLTRIGYKKVINSFCTGYKTVYQAKFSNGAELICTASHNFYVNNTKKQLINLTASDALSILDIPKTKETVCQNLVNLFIFGLMGKSIIVTRSLKAVLIGFITIEDALNRCIKTHGNFIKGQFQKGCAFITEMAIPKTIPSTTSILCQGVNTKDNIYVSQEGLNHKEILTFYKESDHLQKNGTQAKRVDCGIKSIGRSAGKTCLLKLIKYVRIVGKIIKGKSALNFVVSDAKPSGLTNLQRSILNAKYAGQNLKRERQKELEHVQENVVLSSARKLLLKRKTYNITVEDQHEYYANGILVANCLRIGYAGMSTVDWEGPGEQERSIMEPTTIFCAPQDGSQDWMKA